MMRTARRSRHHSRSTIPGMRRCRTCRTLYTAHAMICPHCFPYGGGNLALAAQLKREEFIVDFTPTARIPEPVEGYPSWVYAASLEMNRRGYDTSKLSTVLDKMIDDRAPAAVRDVVRAVLYYRYGQPLPPLNPDTETEAARWLEQGARE